MIKEVDISDAEMKLLNNKKISNQFHESIKVVFKFFECTVAKDGTHEEFNIILADEWKSISSYNLIYIDEKYVESLSETVLSESSALKTILHYVSKIVVDDDEFKNNLPKFFQKIIFEICFYVPFVHEYSHLYDNNDFESSTNENHADSRAMFCVDNFFETYKRHLLTETKLHEEKINNVLSIVLIFSCITYIKYLEGYSASNSPTHPHPEKRGKQSILETFKILEKRGQPHQQVANNFMFVYSEIYKISFDESKRKLENIFY